MPNLVVGLDPGHGGRDKGATQAGFHESDYNLHMCIRASDAAACAGLPISMPLLRREDRDMTLAERGEVANTMCCDAVMSVHTNAAVVASQHGALAFHLDGDLEGQAMANAFLRCVPPPLLRWGDTALAAPEKLLPNERWLQRPRNVLLPHIGKPAALLELGYCTNGSDMRALLCEATQTCIVVAMVAAACRLRAVLEPTRHGT